MEHLLLGSERHGTLYVGCGESIEIRGDYAVVGANGLNTASEEANFRRLRDKTTLRVCKRCARTLESIDRKRLVTR